jgi:hypothetical protein
MAAELSGAARTPDVLPAGADAVIDIPSNGQKNGSYYPVPLIVGLRMSFLLMNAAAPLAALAAKALFFRPRRKRARRLEAANVEWSSLSVNGKRVQIYEFGAGPPVLIVHGWESSVSRLTPLIHEIVAAGFRVVTFDNPAHGESEGVDTDPIEVTTVIHHLAARHGLVCERLVLFAAPASVDMIISLFSQLLSLSAGVRSRLRALIQKRFEPLIIERDLDVAANVARAALPTLILHDVGDKSVPFDEARRLRSLHSGARLVATKGLSHYGVIRDPRAIAACLEFLGQAAVSRRSSEAAPTADMARREAC